MNDVQKFLGAVRADLIERRLWPVLVLLVAGLVAAFVFIGGGPSASPPASTPPPAATAGLAAQGPPLSALPPNTNAAIAETANGTAFQRQSGAHDPFAPLVLPSDTTGPTGTTGASSSSGSSSAGGGSGSGSSGSGGTSVPTPSVPTPPPSSSTPPSSPTPSPSTPPSSSTPSKPKSQTLNADFRFGLVPTTGSSTGTTGPTGPTGPSGAPVPLTDLQDYSNPKTNTPLPSNGPILELLDAGSSGTSLRFSVQQELLINGTGTCLPSPTNCQTIDMSPGDVETLQYDSPSLGPLEYELAVVSVNGHVAASSASLQHGPRNVLAVPAGDTSGQRVAVPVPLTASQTANVNLLRGVLARAHAPAASP